MQMQMQHRIHQLHYSPTLQYTHEVSFGTQHFIWYVACTQVMLSNVLLQFCWTALEWPRFLEDPTTEGRQVSSIPPNVYHLDTSSFLLLIMCTMYNATRTRPAFVLPVLVFLTALAPYTK